MCLMKNRILWVAAAVFLLLTGCEAGAQKDGTSTGRPATGTEPSETGYILKSDVKNINVHLDYTDSELKTIYFAGGCFWGVEAYMARIYGVSEVVSGYANGTGENPSYEDVISGDEGFAETVEVTYDPKRITLETLIDYLFQVIDPTSLNKQGNDVGVQYRTGIYYSDETDAEPVKQAVKKEQEYYKSDVVTEATPLKNFYRAEDFHQDYLQKNPNGYCHVNLHTLDDMAIEPIEQDEAIVKKLSE